MDLASLFGEALFPTRCVVCQAYGSWWCADCQAACELIRRNLCPDCGSLAAVHDCPKGIGADALLAAGFYHDPRLRTAIHALKYKGVTKLSSALAEFLRRWREERLDIWPWAGDAELAIQPLIGAPRSVRERGFDQAELIALMLQDVCVPWAVKADLLIRKPAMLPQVSVERGLLRRANVQGAYQLKAGVEVPKKVLLVDDVMTTGSTLAEAVRVLRAAGAQQVYGFTLAVGA